MCENDYNKNYKCKFSTDVGYTKLNYVCALASTVKCEGLDSDRFKCPYWAMVYHANKKRLSAFILDQLRHWKAFNFMNERKKRATEAAQA